MISHSRKFLLIACLVGLGVQAATGDPDPRYGDAGLRRVGIFTAPFDQLVVDESGRAHVLLVNTITRLTSNGAMDTTFGTAGEVTLPVASGACATHFRQMRAAANGRLLVTRHSPLSPCSPSPSTAERRVLRLNPDGSEDLTFGTAAIVGDGNGLSGVRFLETYPDGTFLFATDELWRFLADGTPDSTFAPHALPSASFRLHAAAQAGGGVVLAEQGDRTTITIYRLTNTGARDLAYGATGSVTIQVPAEGKVVLRGIQSLPDGSVVVALHSREGSGTVERLQVRRYLPDGTPDNDFATRGVLILPSTAIPPPPIADALGAGDARTAMTVQADGKILVASTDSTAGFLRIAVARVLSNGTMDPGFGTEGISFIDASAGADKAYAVASHASGIFMVAGVDSELVRPEASGAPFRAAVMRLQAASSPIRISSSPLLPGGVGRPYSWRLGASLGTAPYTYSLAAGNLPPGISLRGDTLEGTPTAEGRYRFHVRARDSLGVEQTAFLALDVLTDTSLIVDAYGAILMRSAETGGVAFWEDEVDRVVALGADPIDVLHALSVAFFGSTEFAGYRYTNAEYVTRLYFAYLGRDPDAAGRDHWASQIDAGLPRSAILNQFQFTPEYETRMERVLGARLSRPETRMVLDFYRGLLGRLPDSSGFNYWAGRFRAAQCGGDVNAEVESISSLFVSLPEYGNRQAAAAAGERTRAYMADLYNAFLRRGGDAPGFQYWVSQLDSGARDRDEVRRQFIASPEFQARVAAVIQQGCMN